MSVGIGVIVGLEVGAIVDVNTGVTDKVTVGEDKTCGIDEEAERFVNGIK
jgi:hypothetical protein